MSKNAGKQFEKDLLDSVRSWGWWAERFRDNTWNNMQGSSQSPPDMICVSPNKNSFLIEAKAVKVNTIDFLDGSIPQKRCDGHQAARLNHFSKFGFPMVAVLFYTERFRSRSAVLVPYDLWADIPETYDRLSVTLRILREDLDPWYHLKWVGRKSAKGPYVTTLELDPEDPKKDITT